jgi:subtilisin-like proprotein convertase family protein
MTTASRLLAIATIMMAVAGADHGRAALCDFQATGDGHYTATWNGPAQDVPDNNPAGVGFGAGFSATGLQINDISVSLNVSGGWNGDLYAYLSHGDGYAVLLNRVGTVNSGDDGYGTSGFNILLEAVATHPGIADIHNVASPSALPLAYAADGRVAYTDPSGSRTLDGFLNSDPNGSWTLFFTDLSPGSVSTLNGWSVEITTVPEPVNVALGGFGVVFLFFAVVKSQPARKFFRRLLAFGP